MRNLVFLIPLIASPPGAVAGPPRDEVTGSAAAALRRTVTEHLAAGRIDAALRAAQHGLAEHPDDAAVRGEFVSLHLSLARQLLAEEGFTTAERALQAAIKVTPDHAEARRMLAGIQAARRRVPSRIEEARRRLALEWFEPAFMTFRQARALVPEQKDALAASYIEAATGVGDDHYFCKNFHEAFYHYDAAMMLGNNMGSKPSRSLVLRWLQSMVHALGESIDRLRYPPEYWKMVLEKAEAAGPHGPAGRELFTVLRGLAFENSGMPRQAALEYAKLRAQGAAGSAVDATRRNRLAALARIRRWYDHDLSDRRQDIWSRRAGGGWQLLEQARFRVYHRNRPAAKRVADALRFHFDRIAGLLGKDPEKIPWEPACDVHLHADAAAFGKATAQQDDVQAISIIRRRGDRLERHEIHVHQADPMLLSTSLAHELAHLMQAAIVGYRPTVAALNEGLALHAEPRCRHVQFGRLFRRLERPRSVTVLLSVSDLHPPEPAFYAESYRLVATLLARDDGATILARSLVPLDHTRLAESFGFENTQSMERAFAGAGK